MSAETSRPSAFDFLDYRVFIETWLQWKATLRPQYSQRAFARRAGCSHTLISQVVKREKHLSETSARSIGEAMALPEEELEHLLLLVELATASSERHRVELSRRVMGARGMHDARDLGELCRVYLGSWWIPVVRELAARADFQAEPAWIAARMLPPVSHDQVYEALLVLQGLGMLIPDEHGRLRPSPEPLVTAREVDDEGARAWHLAAIELARSGLERIPAEERTYQSALLAVPAGLEEQVMAELRGVAERLVGMVEDARRSQGQGVERVYLCNLQLLPVTAAGPERAGQAAPVHRSARVASRSPTTTGLG